MLKQLASNGCKISNTSKGIYRTSIPNLKFEIQIIVSSELNEKEHVWLTSLTDSILKRNVETLVLKTNELNAKDDKEYADSVLQVVMQKNSAVFKELKGDNAMCEALRELMKPEIEAEIEAATAQKDAEIKQKDAEIEQLKKQLEQARASKG